MSCFCDNKKAAGRKVTTWASKCSWGQINSHGTSSDKGKNGPRGNWNKKRKMLFNWKGTTEENNGFEKRQERRIAAQNSDDSDDSSP